jgi:predicted glycosyltransferase involved in capsule biosynthesis
VISFLIPFRSDEPHRVESLDYIHQHLAHSFPDDEVITLTNGGEFNRSVARNMAAMAARSDTLVFVDADSYVPMPQLKTAISMVEDGERQWVFPYDSYNSLTEGSSVVFRRGVRSGLLCEYIFPSEEYPEPAVGGCIVVSRKAFETVGGYDERFIGWGEEDRAFQMSLHTLVEQIARVPGPLYHLWHLHPEEECFDQPHFMDNRRLCNRYREAYANPQMMQQIVSELR